MILHIDAQNRIALVEPRDLKRFKVSVDRRPSDYTDVARYNSDTVRLQDEKTAWVSLAHLVTLSELGSDVRWAEDFQAMLAYCKKMGWLSDDGRDVRAHVEWNA